jgi:hypothetical protein
VRARASIALAIVLLSTLASSAQAQRAHVNVTMVANRTDVEVGDVFQLQVRADVQNADRQAQIDLPDLSAFDVISRQISNPVSFRIGFGTNTQTVQQTTIHTLTLRAHQAGTVELRPAVVLIGRQRWESQPLTIRVGGGGSAAPGQAPPSSPSLPPASSIDSSIFDHEGFVHTIVDLPEPVVGQQITVTVRLYMRRGMSGNLQITQEPTAEGFWTHDLLPPSRQIQPEQQNVGGLDFDVYLLRRIAAFPQRAGELTIGGTAVDVVNNDPFAILRGGNMGGLVLRRAGAPVTVHVRELPAPRPDGHVHVGRLELEAALDRSSVPTGDAVQLTVNVRGTGELRQLSIEIPAVDGLRVLAPEIDDRVEAPGDVVGGARTMRWLIVPERPGSFTVPPFEIPTFDPALRTYGVARTAALRIDAAGNAVEEPSEPEPAGAEAREPELEIAPIRTRSALARTRTSVLDAPWFGPLFAIGPLILLAAAIARLAQRRRTSGAAARTPKHAQREAGKRLAQASKHLAAGEAREFYGAVATALKDVLEAKLGRPVGRFTHAELRRHLGERGMDAELADAVVEELEGGDFARFSAVGVRPEEMERCLTRARGLLDRLGRFTAKSEVTE